MLRRSKTLSIVMSLCLCLAMLAPVFVAPQAAQADSAITYDVASTFTTTTGTAAKTVDAKVLITVAEPSVIGDATYSSYVTVKLPSGVELDRDNDVDATATTPKIVDGVSIASTNQAAKESLDAEIVPVNKTQFDIKVAYKGDGTQEDAKLMLTFKTLKVKSGSGDVAINFVAPSGSPFPSESVTIGKRVSGGQTNTSIASVKSIGDGTFAIDSITIEELVSETLKANNKIKLTLTKGFQWDTHYTDSDNNDLSTEVKGGWAYPEDVNADIEGDGTKDLVITLPKDFAKYPAPGKLVLSNLYVSTTNTADFGDVEVDVDSDNNSDVTEQTITVAKYADFGVTIAEGTKETVTSGRTEQEIGEFYINEGVAGSLLKDRSLKLELPDGAEWVTTKDADGDVSLVSSSEPKYECVDGDVDLDKWTIEDSDNQILKTTVKKASSGDAASIKIKDAEIKVKPDFEGPIEITVSGSAGAKGTVKVGEAVKPVKISAENVKDIIVGQASQKVADIILTESDKDMIKDESIFKDIVISLDDGYKFTSKPTVTVEEGNLEIDSTKLQNEDNDLKIVIESGSSKASKIRISDVNITAYRYVPVGPVKAELVGADFDDTDNNGIIDAKDKAIGGSTALVDWDTDKSMGNVVIANCVTPAEGLSSQFKIGSNVYTVNGVAKIMDVAPYIKNSRTYVPVRYLAYALGVSESDVVWDAATNKVTITKGDKVVELTIGSTTITVNGEAQTMDVAPEIANSRTMLPARFVAEGLGATVGWDAASNTVYVQQ